ncbi:unnamed protein product [Pedinophyceae sp. YPF-701]|nr:unnamed protein product [Pedinophyceae sp. YPF-701]
MSGQTVVNSSRDRVHSGWSRVRLFHLDGEHWRVRGTGRVAITTSDEDPLEQRLVVEGDGGDTLVNRAVPARGRVKQQCGLLISWQEEGQETVLSFASPVDCERTWYQLTGQTRKVYRDADASSSTSRVDTHDIDAECRDAPTPTRGGDGWESATSCDPLRRMESREATGGAPPQADPLALDQGMCCTHKLRWCPTSVKCALKWQERLLDDCGHFLPESQFVLIGPSQPDYIHTLVAGKPSAPPLVILPGYGAAAGYFFKAIPYLARNWRVYIVDWLGTGLSGRPRFPVRPKDAIDERARVKAEGFFIDSLEKWRKVMGIAKMVLVGHSLGGYLVGRYALKYPAAVVHAILASPPGLKDRPEGFSDEEYLEATNEHHSKLTGIVIKICSKLWNKGLTPGALTRAMGPLGKLVVYSYTQKRFHDQPDGGVPLEKEELHHFKRYIYHVTAQPKCGDAALRFILAPYAWPRNALGPHLRHRKVPMTVLFGDKDWLDSTGLDEMIADLRREAGQHCALDMDLVTMHNAGHFLFMDQPGEFDRFLGTVAKMHGIPWSGGEEGAEFFAAPRPVKNEVHLNPAKPADLVETME